MAIAAGSEDSQRNPDIPQPLPQNAEGLQYARLDASGSADPDTDEQQDFEEREYGRQDEAEASSSSWGSDAEDSNSGDHNSVWTLEFQAAEDGPSEFADTATFQSSADFDHDNADKIPPVDQCGAGQPAWVQPWSSESSPGKKPAQLRANGIQAARTQPGGNVLQELPKSKFQQETMSEEHKTAIIGAMKNIKIDYVPRWAMSLSDDKWLNKLSTKVRTGQATKS